MKISCQPLLCLKINKPNNYEQDVISQNGKRYFYTSNGTVSDIDGNFTISTNKSNTLVISYLGYTSQEVSAKELANKPVTSTAQALAGLAPGLSVLQNSGRPGAGASVKIRGTGTFSSAGNSPLVLIDGLSGSLDDVDPNDIQNIFIVFSLIFQLKLSILSPFLV